MIEIVINYDDTQGHYKIYEPSTDTLMASTNLTEALVLLNKFLLDKGLSTVDILQCPNISYHIDSKTMRAIVEGNMNLLKRLDTAPSGFMISSQRFGGGIQKEKPQQQKESSSKKSYSGLSGAKSFRDSFKKFGGR